MTAARAGRPTGFTLVELMLASLIFSMVVAGLAAIYSTAFKQSGKIITDTRVKSTAAIALRHITQQLASVNRIDEPANGASGSVVRACSNVATDGNQITTAVGISAVAFCVQPGTVGLCASPGAPPPCLFYYGFAGICPAPAVSAANCGTTISGVAPFLLGAHLEASSNPTMPDYFSRSSGGANTGNLLRVAFQISRDATATQPKVIYNVDTMVAGQFDARL